MNKLLTAALLAAATFASAPAAMATSKYNYCNGGSSDPSCPTFKFTSNGTASASGVDVSASAWYDSAPTSNDTLHSADLYYYSGSGLGVKTDTNNYPEHAVDNSDSEYEWIMLSFEKAVSLDKITLGWVGSDYDITVLASNTAASNLSGWTFIDNIYNTDFTYDSYGKKIASVDTEDCASYWLIGAINPSFAQSKYVGNDYFKLYSVAACTDCGTPGTGVAEPGSLALAGLGVIGMLGMRRRRK